jgi:PAS domain S-box-containing protein
MPRIEAMVMAIAVLAATGLIALMLRRRWQVVASGQTRAKDTRILAEHVVDNISTHDTDGTFRYVSPVFAGLLGEYPGTLVGRHPREFAHPDDAAALAGLWKRAVEWTGIPATVTWRCRRHDGEYAWLESTARAAAGDAAELGAIVCASRDVTERKQIEDALRESEQRFRTTLETVRLVAVGLDTAGRVTFCNDSFTALTGWKRAELVGENWFDRCVPPGNRVRNVFYNNIATGEIPPKLEHEIICRDGKRRMIDWDNTVLRTPTGEVLGTASLGADVTEARQEEAALKLLQSITLAISASNDLNGALSLTLESLCGATGWGYGEAWLPTSDGSRVERITHFAAVGVEALPLVRSADDLTFAPGEGLAGTAWEAKNVVWVPDIDARVPHAALPRASKALECGFRAAVAVPVLAGDNVVAVLEFFMDRPRATDVRHTQLVEVVANQVGVVIERRHAQKKFEAEILHARDSAEAASRTKSDFLSRMSHELRTPLNSVIGFANVMRKNKSGRLTDADLVYLDRIIANGQHLLTLVNNVLDIAKVEAGRMTVTKGLVAVGELLRGVVAQLEGQPRSPSVSLVADVPDGMIPIESDLVLLRQVLINLAGNALRFTHEGSIILAAEADPATGLPLRIHVSDTGIGITPERQEAIFEPFEQADPETHRSYGGTGLGLSISKAICDELGYRLTVESEVGKGSRFTVHLDSVSESDRGVPISDSSTVRRKSGRSLETQQS